MEKIIDYSIKNDIIFKHVFSNEDVLKNFLEAILNKKINTIEIDKQYNLQKINFSDKELYLDVKATINNEEIVVLEMQKSKDPDFINRLVLYISAINREQIETAEEYNKLKKVYSLAILNYTIRNDIEKYHTIWAMTEESNLKYKLEETPSIHMMELTKFKNMNPKLESRADLWLAYIEGTNPEWVNKAMKENKYIEEAEKIRQDFLADENNRLLIDKYEIWKLDERSKEKRAEEKGEIKGFENGVKSTIISMHKKGIDVKTIAEIVNKTEEEVNEIISKK